MAAPAQRGETMIALRARREAMQVAEPIAYPHLEVPPPRMPTRPIEEFERPYRLWLLPAEWRFPLPAQYLAPWWMIWLFTGCVALISVAAFFVFK